MPKARFAPKTAIVVVTVELINEVADRSVMANMLLDTGATYTAIPKRVAKGLGLSIDPKRKRRILTASGSFELVPWVKLDRVRVLGQSSEDVEAVIINLPSSTGLDGLLGGSYLKDYRVLIDYPQGILEIGG